MGGQKSTIKKTTKYSECYVNLVDQAVVGLERIESNVDRSSAVGKCYQTDLHAIEKGSTDVTFFSYFKKLPQLSESLETITMINTVSSHQYRCKTLHRQKHCNSLKAQIIFSIFSNEVFLIQVYTLFY